LYVELASGKSASFNVSSSSCNRTITFSRSGGWFARMGNEEVNNEEPDDFSGMGKEKIDIYPNPSPQFLIVENVKSTIDFAISDSHGVIVKRGKINTDQDRIDINDLPKGAYILIMNSQRRRFLKQ
jgi:hypothetical protein